MQQVNEILNQDEETSMFELNWSYFDKNLRCAFANPGSLRKYSDVTFLCQDKTLYAHKIILHAGSDYFRNLFEDRRANNNLIIYMYHVKGIVLKKLLEYLYCGVVHIEKKYLQEFIMLGESLKVKGLVNVHNETSTKNSSSNDLPKLKRKQDTIQSSPLQKKVKETILTSKDNSETSEDELPIKHIADRIQESNVLGDSLDVLNEMTHDQDEEEFRTSFRKTLTKSFTRYQRIVANIKKDDDLVHEMTKGTRRRCGQCSIQKVERRTSYFCKGCNIALCLECFEPFHKTFDADSEANK